MHSSRNMQLSTKKTILICLMFSSCFFVAVFVYNDEQGVRGRFEEYVYNCPVSCNATAPCENEKSVAIQKPSDNCNRSIGKSSPECNCKKSASLSNVTPKTLTQGEKTKVRRGSVKPLLMLSWTAMNMPPNTHSEVWFSPKLPAENVFDQCYTKQFLDPDIYPCQYTNKRQDFDKSEVVLFRGRRMREIPLPRVHPPDQLWMFYEFEPPYKAWMRTNLTKYNGVFNITSTYASDSDVPLHHHIKNCVQRNNTQSMQIDYFSKKTRPNPVAWFVSICTTQSKREQYVKELQKYIGVDIYGKCGPLKCGSNAPGYHGNDKCDETLLHNNNSYHFYLSFENSLCEDYVTEKLWRMINLDVIPVVMGAVDYSNILPKNAYIDARDFKSPQLLAEYLHKVMNDRNLYNGYIKNKNSLSCAPLQPDIPKGCKVCKALHELRGRRQIVYNLDRFWGIRRCVNPADFLRTKPDGSFDTRGEITWKQD